MGLSIAVTNNPHWPYGGGADPLAIMRSRIDDYGGAFWDFQDASGAVAVAYNSALTVPDTRDVALGTYGDYTAGAGWSNPGTEIAQHAAASGTATLQQDDILAAGKTYQVTITVANRTAGSITITEGGAAIAGNGEVTRTITSTGTDFIITPTTDFDGDIDVAILLVQQTGILASSAYPGGAGNPLNGATTGATVAQPGPAGLLAYDFDAANDYVNAYSDELNSMFDPTQGTLIVAAKVSGAGVWTDGATRYLAKLYADAQNYIIIVKSTTNNTLAFQYRAGNTLEASNHTFSSVGWFMVAITWDTIANRVNYYVNGLLVDFDTALGAWVGNLDSTQTVIGASNTTPQNIFDGSLTVPVLYRDVLTDAEILEIAQSLGVA